MTEVKENMELAEVQENALQIEQQEPQKAKTLTMWNDPATMRTAYRMAEMLSKSDVIPQAYKGKPGDCLIAIDIANRMNISPLMVMGASQVVRGNFTWKGTACKALIDGCGLYRGSEYIMFGDQNTDDWGCYLQAVEAKTGKVVKGPEVTWNMAVKEGWVGKDGSKWKTMPSLMARYRAAAFFARTECPQVLMGFQTAEEVEDVAGIDKPKETIKLTLNS